MSIIIRVNSLVSKSRVFLVQTTVFRKVGLIPKVRDHRLDLPRHFTSKPASCQYRHRETLSTFHFDAKRGFSETYGESSNPSKKTDVVGEESHNMLSDHSDDSALNQRSSETFTLEVLVSLLRQENASDICVIKVPEQIKYAEYFLVVSGVSPRHLRAMALYAIKVYKFLKRDYDRNVKIEGKDTEDWMCIDFGNMVVHFMLPETRELYELEKLWTLRSYDEQLRRIPAETLPEDFIYDLEVTK